jgi:hypothetical protein
MDWLIPASELTVRVKAVVAQFMRAEAHYSVLMLAFRWAPNPAPD